MARTQGTGGGRRGAGSQPEAVAAAPDDLGADERDLLRIFWTAEALPRSRARGPMAVALDEFALGAAWLRLREGRTGHIFADQATQDRVDALARGLVAQGYLVGPGPGERTVRRPWDGPPFALSGAGRQAVAAAVPQWWSAEGLLVPAAGVQARPAVAPAEAVATFARVLAVADGLPLAGAGRPTRASQRELVRCLPPAPDGPAPARGRSGTGGGEAAPDGEEAAAPQNGEAATPWAGFEPRLGIWLATAAYEGLLQRDGATGARGRWTVPDVGRWLDLPPEEQWARLARSWARAAAASAVAVLAVGRLAGHAPGAAWLVPDRLVDWLDRHGGGAARMGPHLRDAVVRAGADLGVLALGSVDAGSARGGRSPALACALTQAGARALRGESPAGWPRAEPAAAASDLTVVQPLAALPRAAYGLRRVAELQGIDRVASYRLTQAAWTAARARGDDPLDLWDAAMEGSRQPVPQNVAFTLEQDWSDESRRATVETVLLLRFPAEEVAAAARRDATLRQAVREQLTATAWVLDPGREAAVRRVLQKLGIAPDAGGDPRAEVAAAAGPGRHPPLAGAGSGTAGFRLPWPGPFGAPEHGGGPEGLLGGDDARAVPPALVRMPSQALYRRLRLASRNREEVWVDLAEEGVVRFLPEQVTRASLFGQCRGCGRTHSVELGEVRAMLDGQAGER